MPSRQRKVPAEVSEAVKNGAFENRRGCQGGWHTYNKGDDTAG